MGEWVDGGWVDFLSPLHLCIHTDRTHTHTHSPVQHHDQGPLLVSLLVVGVGDHRKGRPVDGLPQGVLARDINHFTILRLIVASCVCRWMCVYMIYEGTSRWLIWL